MKYLLYFVLDSFSASVPVLYGNTNPSSGSTSAGININTESTNQNDYDSHQPLDGE